MTDAQRRALEQHWPRYGIDDAGGFLDFTALFGRSAPVVLEIGFGDGDALFESAAGHPRCDFIGVEVHRPGVGALLRRAAAAGVDNLRVIMQDAVEVLENRIPPASLTEVRLYFPDPWPKKRHHKRRIVQPGFVALVADRLVTGGRLHVATDWQDYADRILEVLRGCAALRDRTDSVEGGVRPETRFERRGLRLGHTVRDFVFTRESP